jgi:hypothetical protein
VLATTIIIMLFDPGMVIVRLERFKTNGTDRETPDGSAPTIAASLLNRGTTQGRFVVHWIEITLIPESGAQISSSNDGAPPTGVYFVVVPFSAVMLLDRTKTDFGMLSEDAAT